MSDPRVRASAALTTAALTVVEFAAAAWLLAGSPSLIALLFVAIASIAANSILKKLVLAVAIAQGQYAENAPASVRAMAGMLLAGSGPWLSVATFFAAYLKPLATSVFRGLAAGGFIGCVVGVFSRESLAPLSGFFANLAFAIPCALAAIGVVALVAGSRFHRGVATLAGLLVAGVALWNASWFGFHPLGGFGLCVAEVCVLVQIGFLFLGLRLVGAALQKAAFEQAEDERSMRETLVKFEQGLAEKVGADEARRIVQSMDD